jgi:hypothetical protein
MNICIFELIPLSALSRAWNDALETALEIFMDNITPLFSNKSTSLFLPIGDVSSADSALSSSSLSVKKRVNM